MWNGIFGSFKNLSQFKNWFLVIGILVLSICSVRVSKAFPAKISSPGYFKDRFEFITQNENNDNPNQNLEPTMKPKPNRKVTQWARKFKKVPAKKLVKSNKANFLFHEIAFLSVLNLLPFQKWIFSHIWNCKKWNLVKNLSWNWFFLFHEFFLAWTFLNFLAHCG